MRRRSGRLSAPPCSLFFLTRGVQPRSFATTQRGKSSSSASRRRSSPHARGKNRVILAVVCAATGTCSLVAWVRLPSSGTPKPSVGPHARCSPVLAAQGQPGAAARRRRWHSGQSSGGQQQRKSFVHFFSVVALGFFSWADKPEPAVAEEVGPTTPSHRVGEEVAALRTYLLNSGIATKVGTSSSHGGRNSRRGFLFFRHLIGQNPEESRDESSKGVVEASHTRGSTLDLAHPVSAQAEDNAAQEASSGGLLAFFAAIKAAVFSVLFGDRDEEDEKSEAKQRKEAKALPEPQGPLPVAVPSFELPKPEAAQDWLSSTWEGFSGESSPPRSQAAPVRQAEVVASVPVETGPQERTKEAKIEDKPASERADEDDQSSTATAEAQEPEVSLASLPDPDVPGLDEADLIVQVEIKPKTKVAKVQGEEGMQRLMRQSGGEILATMGQSGWKVETVDESKNLYSLSLPAVRYDLPGCKVSIPSPVFATTIYDSFQKTGDYEERLQGDLVLQNGKDILTVEFKFPFNKTISISAAGWTRSRVGWEGDAVKISNYLEIGLQLPKVFGLEKIMQLFVNQYGTESTLNCAVALANGADVIDLDEPEWWESAQQAVSESSRAITDALTAAVPAESEGEKSEEAKVLPDTESEQREETEAAPSEVASLSPVVADQEVKPAEPEWWESGLALLGTNEEEDKPTDQTPAVVTAKESQPRGAVPDPADHPHPEAPGMDEANLIVHTDVDPKNSVAKSGEDGVDRLMAQSGGAILKTMAQEGWEVETVDEAKNLYEMSLPAVRYEVAGAVVSIPSPRFLTTVYNTCRSGEGDYEERLFGDLVLQNGEDILTVELGFPFRTSFTISAAGWCRAVVGRKKDSIVIGATVEIGLQLPKFPGLDSIMKYFVKAYGSQSTEDCSQALARGADALPVEGATPEWLQSGIDAVAESIGSVLETVPELPDTQDDASSEEENRRTRKAP